MLLSSAQGLSFNACEAGQHVVHSVPHSTVVSDVRSHLNISFCDQRDRKDLCLFQITNAHWWKLAGRGWWKWERHALIPSAPALLYRMMSGLIWLSASSLSRRRRPLLFPLNSPFDLLTASLTYIQVSHYGPSLYLFGIHRLNCSCKEHVQQQIMLLFTYSYIFLLSIMQRV